MAAIFELERIAAVSGEHRALVGEVLAGFVRATSPRDRTFTPELTMPPPLGDVPSAPEDIQAALTVIGRRDAAYARQQETLDLSWTNLMGVKLDGASLVRVNLQGADLSRANLMEANLGETFLRGASLSSANLSGAVLAGADLVMANLAGATLFRADLSGGVLMATSLYRADMIQASLRGADLAGAYFVDANLTGADLSDARRLEAEQLGCTLVESSTRLPAGIEPPRKRARPCPVF